MANLKLVTMETLAKTTLFELHRPYVFVVDMINGFIKEGALSDSGIMDISQPIADLLKKAKDCSFVCDSHNLDAREFESYPIHCVENTDESKVIKELEMYANHIIHKNSTNTFIAKEFQDRLPELLANYDDFVIVGCCSDICILHFALSLQTFFNEANMNLKRVIVPVNMIETFDIPGVHDRDTENQIACDLMIRNGIQVVIMEN
ncbi:hypothetical protein A4S06_04380 [Erysipelotrichaceae bacterium MTC7]|nr:hypothetical protein A4S06_04380 [Erysipelotrichaceae bacterium MTC7]